MLGIVLAIVASLTWGVGGAVARMGLQRAAPSTGTLVSILSGLVVIAIVALGLNLADLRAITPGVVLWFALVGVVNFAAGRYLNYLGYKYIGAARGSSLAATSPFFAILLAMLFTGESLPPLVAVGAALIVVGSYLVMSSQGG